MADVLNEKELPKAEPKDNLSLLAQVAEHGNKLPELPISPGANAALAGEFRLEHVNTNPVLGDLFTPTAEGWTQATFPQASFQKPFLGAELKAPAIAAGLGAAGGAALTGLTEYGVTKLVEPLAKASGAIIFSMIGGAELGSQILRAAALPWYACITPKPLLLGATGGALIGAAAFEILKDHSK